MKSTLVIIVATIIILTIFAGIGVWKWDQEKNKFNDEKISQTETVQKQPNISETDLVWYETPELGARFKVTPDAKEDLRYFIDRNEKVNATTAIFYSLSEKKYLEENSPIKRDALADYVSFSISRISTENNKKSLQQGRIWCQPTNELAQMNGFVYCTESPQVYMFDSNEQEKEYDETVRNKKFGYYLKTIEELK